MHLDERFSRRLVSISAADLERFIHHLVSLRVSEYAGHMKYAGTGDLGRDVVGFLSSQKLDGDWHNFQCKHYARPLSENTVLGELGKVIFHASRGHFTLPSRYVFVAPLNVSAAARGLIDRPSGMRKRILSEWNRVCAPAISKQAPPELDGQVKQFIDRFDFSSVEVWDNAIILTLPETPFAAARIFDDDPGEAPRGTVPAIVDEEVEHYGDQLRMLYSEHDGAEFADMRSVQAHPVHGVDLKMHRQRYFDAVEFDRFFRVRVGEERVDEFRESVRSIVHESYAAGSGLGRVRSVMSAAGGGRVGGLFGRHERVSPSVRQGTCHVFANEGSMPWWKAK